MGTARSHGLFLLVIGSLTLSLAACSASLDRKGVQASSGAPVSAQVEQRSIPRRPGLPTYVVAVEPFEVTPDSYTNDREVTLRVQEGSQQLTAKFVTALTNVGNISVLDPRGLKRRADGGYSATLSANERGPFLVRATVTEFGENIQHSNSDRGLSLGWIGIVAGIAGAVTDTPGLTWSGAGVAAANPNFSDKRLKREGVVAIDIQVIDGRTLRVVHASKASGTFSAETSNAGWSLFGYSDHSEEFAQSVLGQAVQAAFNDAIEKIANGLIGA